MVNIGQLINNWLNAPNPSAELQITVGQGSQLIEPLNGPGGVVPAGGPGVTSVDASTSAVPVAASLAAGLATWGNGPAAVPGSVRIVHGSPQADLLVGGSQPAVLMGDGGNDVLVGGSAPTTFVPGQGSNTLVAGSGPATVNYAALGPLHVNLATGIASHLGGTDTLLGVENVIGSAGSDVITGDAHNNVIVGGPGVDVLTGGGGHDTFAYLSPADFGDIITDFHSGQDTIAIQHGAVTGLSATGSLPPSQFATVGTAAQGHTPLFFASDTHTLYAEEPGGPQAVATLPGATITSSDIHFF